MNLSLSLPLSPAILSSGPEDRAPRWRGAPATQRQPSAERGVVVGVRRAFHSGSATRRCAAEASPAGPASGGPPSSLFVGRRPRARPSAVQRSTSNLRAENRAGSPTRGHCFFPLCSPRIDGPIRGHQSSEPPGGPLDCGLRGPAARMMRMRVRERGATRGRARRRTRASCQALPAGRPSRSVPFERMCSVRASGAGECGCPVATSNRQ